MRTVTRLFLVLGLGVAAAVGITAAPASAALPGYVCGTMTGGSTTVHSHITDVRVGQHANFDRFVITFDTLRVPHWRITPKSSTDFTRDPSNTPVHLLGSAGLKVVLHSATGVGSYHGPLDFRTAFPQLLEARQIGDFEGYVTWAMGLDHPSCKRVFKLASPTRLVIDVPH